MNDFQYLLDSIMEGRGKNKGYSLKKIRALDQASKGILVQYLSEIRMPIPEALFPVGFPSLEFAAQKGYTRSCVENGILVYKV